MANQYHLYFLICTNRLTVLHSEEEYSHLRQWPPSYFPSQLIVGSPSHVRTCTVSSSWTHELANVSKVRVHGTEEHTEYMYMTRQQNRYTRWTQGIEGECEQAERCSVQSCVVYKSRILTLHKTLTMSSLHVSALNRCLLQCEVVSLWSTDCEAPQAWSPVLYMPAQAYMCTCFLPCLAKPIVPFKCACVAKP